MFNITELTCRVCLQERNVLINIYDELEELNSNLSDLLEKCASLQINKNDIFPKYLCEDCTRELLITSKFREKCKKSKEILYEILENTKVVENDELINSNDIIEYCMEDTNDVENYDWITQGTPIDKVRNSVNLNNEIELMEHNIPLPSLNENIESLKDTNFCAQSEHKNVIEKVALFVGYSKEFHVNSEPSEETELNSVRGVGNKKASMINLKSLGAKVKSTSVFKCDICGAIFKQAINLQKHLQRSHDKIPSYTCNKCECCFTLETEYYKHVKHCTFLTNEVKLRIENKNSKQGKIVGTTVKLEDNRNKCEYCKRDFNTPFALRMHLRTHTGERPFQCKYCTKSFKTQSQLNVHHKRHTGQADFICTICNKTFYEQSNLTVHMRSHTGERPHVCMVCNKTFTRVFLLQFHMRTHTGEKPFVCNYCNKSFRQQTDLRSHLTIHTGQKQHSCNLCGKSYIKRSHLIQHMRKHQININSGDSSDAVKFGNDHCSSDISHDAVENYVLSSENLYSFDEIK